MAPMKRTCVRKVIVDLSEKAKKYNMVSEAEKLEKNRRVYSRGSMRYFYGMYALKCTKIEM